MDGGPELRGAFRIDGVGFGDIALGLVIGQLLLVLLGQEAAGQLEQAGRSRTGCCAGLSTGAPCNVGLPSRPRFLSA